MAHAGKRTRNRSRGFLPKSPRRVLIHPVVLVGIALLLRPRVAPALVKWAGTGALAVAACWLVADPLMRTPALRRIL